MSKRLLFFFDGTANSAAEGNWSDTTNVFRLNVAFHHEGNQIVFYMPGVGTRGDVLSRATGRGLDHIIREAYVNLSSNYQPGDELYLFGFSRGAAAARALTGLVCKAGLLYPHELDHLNGLWQFFTADERMPSIKMRQLRRDHIEGRVWARGDQPVFNFVGVFDTVAGKSWDKLNLFTKVRFANLRPDPQVKVGVHLLAIDDTRNPSYSPLLWTTRSDPTQTIEQIWMPGVHADIGGKKN